MGTVLASGDDELGLDVWLAAQEALRRLEQILQLERATGLTFQERLQRLKDLKAWDEHQRRQRQSADDGPAELIPIDGVPIARYGDERPGVCRSQHDDFERVETVTESSRAYAYRQRDIIGKWLEKGWITVSQAKAGTRFKGIYHRAHMEPIGSPDLRRIPGQASMEESPSVAKARNDLHECMRALGGRGTPIAEAAWYVLGAEQSIAGYMKSEPFAVQHSTVTGLVIGALQVLELHFRKLERNDA